MRFRPFVIILLTFSCFTAIYPQYYDTGEDPASLKWQQIKTGRFKIIYPENYGKEALNFAASLDKSFTKLSSFYSIKKTRFPVVIHNYTINSNGYVAWAPKRMEIYPTPEQSSIPLDPVEQLTLHELTHVMQMYSLKKGFSRFLSLFAGEQAYGLASGLIPMWFMEGDAVLSESALSPSGRGRTPYFQKQMKALVTEKDKLFSYDKMLLDSYKNYIPDHYQLGYQMVSWLQSKYGHTVLNKALDYTARFPFLIYPVSLSNIKNTGLSNSRLYSQTYDTLKNIWNREMPEDGSGTGEVINRSKRKDYINYYSPVVTGRDSVIAIKTSLFSPPSFVLVNSITGEEKRIHVPGDIYPWFLSGTKGKIVWVEQEPDPRWANRAYSVIKIMNLKSKKVTRLSRNTRYMSASISPDGRFIAASENTSDNKNSLVIIDAFNGDMISTIRSPDNAYLQRPQWSASGNEITAISLTTDGEGILSYSLKMGGWKSLLAPGRIDLQSSFLRNDSLFYVSSYSGTDNIYILAPDGTRSMITDSRYGAYDLFPDGNGVYYSDYSSSGYNISRAAIRDATAPADPGRQKESFLINRFDTLSNKKVDASPVVYNSEPYRKFLHPFRFHSWMPFYADIEEVQSDPTNISPGLTFLSQNTLSTVVSSIGYEYSENKHLIHTKLVWKGWIPVIESRIDYGGAPIISKPSQASDPATVLPGFTFTNSISIPLSFRSGRYSQYIWSSFSASYENNYIYLKESGTFDYGQTQFVARMFFANQYQTAYRDIYPRWAQTLDLSATFFPSDNNIYGPLNSIKTAFYFPGFIRNNGIRIRVEGDRQEPEKMLLYNRASFPRGYNDIISFELKFISADYVMPLLYPDLNIPGFLFLKRIRGGLFYDFARGTNNRYLDTNVFHNYTENFRSFGTELVADFNILRIPFTITAGARSAWKEINKAPVVEMIFRLDIYGMKVGKKRI